MGHVVGVHCSSKVGEYHEAFGGPGGPGSSAPCGVIAKKGNRKLRLQWWYYGRNPTDSRASDPVVWAFVLPC